MGHECIQSGRLEQIEKSVEEIKKNLDGKGGLNSNVAVLYQTTKQQGININELSKSVRTLVNFMTATEAEKEAVIRVTKENRQLQMEKQKSESSRKAYRTATIISVASLIITLIGILIKNL